MGQLQLVRHAKKNIHSFSTSTEKKIKAAWFHVVRATKENKSTCSMALSTDFGT